MLEKEIKTSKGTFVVNNYRKGVALIDITEESASDVVDERQLERWQKRIGFYKYNDYSKETKYGFPDLRYATESLHSLIKANKIEITNKLYIFKK